MKLFILPLMALAAACSITQKIEPVAQPKVDSAYLLALFMFFSGRRFMRRLTRFLFRQC